MINAPDGQTTISADLIDAADAVASRNSCSASAQLEHWARVGKALSERVPVAARQVHRALAGEIDREDLDATESLIFDAEIEAGIAARIASTNYAEKRAAIGLSSVALNATGDIIEHSPDGTTRHLSGG